MGSRVLVFCDESAKKGPHFSNFYGASIVLSENLSEIEQRIRDISVNMGITCELKWNNISPSTFERFIKIVDAYFDFVESGKIKFRCLFTQNVWIPQGLNQEQISNAYFLLYYQFIKNGIGLSQYNSIHGSRDLQLIFDQFPKNQTQISEFKTFLSRLNSRTLFRNGLHLSTENIGEAKSHAHFILQCTDIILGSIQFRLNDYHLAIPEGKRRRGKKTIAKHKVYQHISKRIRKIYPHFNIGISTGIQGNRANRWLHPYRHWLLVPRLREYDKSKGKKKKALHAL
jgi:Protein of unknown function (DUF3800)